MSRLALRLLGAGVVLFHGKLLWDRLTDGSMVQLGVLAQWLVAALLVSGLTLVYRQQGRLFRGREAAILWILVALLHAMTGVPTTQTVAVQTSLLALPLTLLVTAFVAGLTGRRFAPPARLSSHRGAAGFSPATLPGHGGVAGSRAPPR